MSSLALYLAGYVVLIAGLAYGAALLGVAPSWIVAGAIVLAGVALITGATRTRSRPGDDGREGSP